MEQVELELAPIGVAGILVTVLPDLPQGKLLPFFFKYPVTTGIVDVVTMTTASTQLIET